MPIVYVKDFKKVKRYKGDAIYVFEDDINGTTTNVYSKYRNEQSISIPTISVSVKETRGRDLKVNKEVMTKLYHQLTLLEDAFNNNKFIVLPLTRLGKYLTDLEVSNPIIYETITKTLLTLDKKYLEKTKI